MFSNLIGLICIIISIKISIIVDIAIIKIIIFCRSIMHLWKNATVIYADEDRQITICSKEIKVVNKLSSPYSFGRI